LGADIANTFKQAQKERDKTTTGNNNNTNSSAGGRGRGRYNNGNRTTNTGGGSSSTGGSTGSANPGRPSGEEAKKLMQEGRCFICRETGHRMNECPSKGRNKNAVNELTPETLEQRNARIAALLDREFGKQVTTATPKAPASDHGSEN
jgi:hypothetical protein